jgi:hypothetical protein
MCIQIWLLAIEPCWSIALTLLSDYHLITFSNFEELMEGMKTCG